MELPQVTVDQNEQLGEPISEEEVRPAIGTLKLHKSPGPDRLTAQFYKTFSSELIPHMTSLFNHIADTKHVTHTMIEDIILIIPKQGKGTQHCDSYRPIALLNLEAKLYSKILASRLEGLMPDLINRDQSGFIKGRQMQDNVRSVIHLIEDTKRHILAVLLSLDAKKAFDRVDWPFLFHTLQRFGFCKAFIAMIQDNFAAPSARVLVNGVSLDPFILGRGDEKGMLTH